MRGTTRLTNANIDLFIRRSVKGVRLEESKCIPTRPYGTSFVYKCGPNLRLKVRVDCSDAILKEAELTKYLNQRSLPIRVFSPLDVHSKGPHPIYRMIAGQSLTAEIARSLSTVEMNSLTNLLRVFLFLLHGNSRRHHLMLPYQREKLRKKIY